MRLSSFGFRAIGSGCAALAAAALLAGCSDDPGLQERLNRLQAEMQEKDRQMQDVQSALEKTKSELKNARAANSTKPAVADTPALAPNSTPQSLAKAQVEESYAAASKAMQNRVASELRSFSVENCTQFPVVMPSDDFPYHSKVALTLRSDSGHSYRLEFPVSADVAGKWTFPTSVEIAGALAEGRTQDTNNSTASNPTPSATSSPRTVQNNPTPAPSSRPGANTGPQLVPGQTATETRTINWGSPRSTSNNVRPTPAPATNNSLAPAKEIQQPPPQGPQSSRPPAQAMQSDKDVTIHW